MLFQKFTFLISFRVRFLDDYQAYQIHGRLSSITQSNLEDLVSRFAWKNTPRVQGPHLHLSVLYKMEMYDQQLLCRRRYTFKLVKSFWQANLANTILNSLRMQTLIEFLRAVILFLKWDKKKLNSSSFRVIFWAEFEFVFCITLSYRFGPTADFWAEIWAEIKKI